MQTPPREAFMFGLIAAPIILVLVAAEIIGRIVMKLSEFQNELGKADE